jgi:putative acetyltransferase
MTAPDGASPQVSSAFTIREATPEDAGELIAFLKRMLGEPDIALVGAPDEFGVTVEQERRFIAEMAGADNCAMLVAEADGRIIGDITCRGESRRAKQHVGVIGVTVAEGWRDQGLGSALLRAVIDWARGSGVITRLELLVFADNERALHVYQKFGFEIEGRKRQAIFKVGEYHDEYLMALLL